MKMKFSNSLSLCIYLKIVDCSHQLYCLCAVAFGACMLMKLLCFVSRNLLRYECEHQIYGVILFSVIFGYFECDDWIYGNERGSLLKFAEICNWKPLAVHYYSLYKFNRNSIFSVLSFVFLVGFRVSHHSIEKNNGPVKTKHTHLIKWAHQILYTFIQIIIIYLMHLAPR